MMKKMKQRVKKTIKWYFEQSAKSYTNCPTGMIPIVNNKIKNS